MKYQPRKHPHRRIHEAHEEHERKLSPMERVGVWASDHLATWQCLTLFSIIAVFCLWGALTSSLFLTLVFGSLSSYVIQLVSLSVIGIGTKVESERNSHVLAHVLRDTEEILRVVKGVPLTVKNEDTGADIIMPNYVKQQFDEGRVSSLADIT